MTVHRSSVASPTYLLAALAAAVTAVGACGGSVSSIDGKGSSSGTSGGSGSGTSGGDSALISMICPTSVPATGGDCLGATSAGKSCEYGGEGDFLSCTTIAVCGKDHKWTVTAPDATCSGSTSKNEAACPSSYAALAAGAACPATLKGSCVYPEGVCECAHCMAPDSGGTGSAWSCAAWPTTAPGCPSPRPRAGTVCTTNGQECNYERLCGAVSLGLPDLKCVSGFWEEQDTPPPPCPFPQCSK